MPDAVDWETIVSTFASGLVGEWVALALVSISMEMWRRQRSRQLKLERKIRRMDDGLRVAVILTRDQILALQACVQALALQAEAEMQLGKAEALHELDKELVQTVGRMACKSVVGMMQTTDFISGDPRI